MTKERDCSTCYYLKAYVSLWCTNQEAIESRGTALPGVYDCPYYKLGITQCSASIGAMRVDNELQTEATKKLKVIQEVCRPSLRDKVLNFIW